MLCRMYLRFCKIWCYQNIPVDEERKRNPHTKESMKETSYCNNRSKISNPFTLFFHQNKTTLKVAIN